MTSFIDDTRVLVAGATGLAGSAVVRALLAASSSVRIRATHRQRAGAFVDDPRVEYVQADLTRREDCRRAAEGCGAAVLAAAVSAGAASAASQPWLQVTDNVVMDSFLLEALHLAGVRRTVFISSASIYQDFQGAIREDQLDWNLDPSAAYLGVGWAKRYAEKLCQFWHAKTGMEVLIGRAANIYGPYAKFDPATSNFIPALIRKAAARLDPFEVWGSPEVTRDVIFADDFGRCVVAMLNATALRFEVFNVGSGAPTTVGEVVDSALRHAGHVPSQVVWRNDGPTTIRARALDVDKAKTMLGWQAEISADEGIRQTLQWWLKSGETWTR